MFVLLYGAALVVGCGVLAWSMPAYGPTAVVASYATLFLPYFLLISELRHGEYSAHAYPPRITFGVLAIAALAARVVMLPAEPLLSDDIYRYVWEGRVTLEGFNPFVHAPNSRVLEPLRDDAIWPLINHREVPTIYPPASQGLFTLNALLGGGVVLLKALLVFVEIAMAAMVWRALHGHASEQTRLMAFGVYALNPLVMVEVAWSGHLDVLAWGSLVAGLVLWQVQARPNLRAAVATGVLVGLSIAAKFLGVLALPFLLTGRFRRDKADQGWMPSSTGARAAAVAVALFVVATSYVPFADAGGKLFSGFGTYAAAWRSNEGGYRALASATQWGLESFASAEDRATPGDMSSDVVFRFEQWDDEFVALGWTKEWEGKTLADTTFTAYGVAQTTAKAMVAFLCALALLWLLLARWQPLAATGVLLFVLYYFAPTVHPWYVAWLVPIVAFRPRAGPLVFSAVVVIGYVAWVSMMGGGKWAIPWWAVAFEYGVVAAVVMVPNKTRLIVEELDTFLP
jgi:hypothetical protein